MKEAPQSPLGKTTSSAKPEVPSHAAPTEEDRTVNMCIKFGALRPYGFRDMQTDRHTDPLITILRTFQGVVIKL